MKVKKIAITGGLACGKSLVCHFLKELGAHVVSADSIVHKLLAQDHAVQAKLKNLFGPDIFVQEQINKAALAKRVFNDPVELKKLEELLHPLVYEAIEKDFLESTAPLFVAEIPLYFESRKKAAFDYVVAVLSEEAKARKRYGKDDFELRKQHQLPIEEKARLADIVLWNNAGKADLEAEVKKMYNTLIEAGVAKGDE